MLLLREECNYKFDDEIMGAFLENGRLVVVDYKTDNLPTEEDFISKYKEQVSVYKKALSVCTDYEVGETYLYSFRLAKEIKVEV